ncbi:alpha/beta-hydrolase [Cucurbitaria berberidis CBS 394.84]|uniref:Alpha/beta-hydrolase n=1 Tax=Cucurbitaria berberidis CBS 394.84 TaxID=1168544 RepID=A0A9P4GTL3_9PLEO|nr:alpha/beta-hydrolase [Cucurbitaria berberidis CBS 394.84]KAF1851097.1 alpha/beta-hydrolase [Cucurbitaria berberidis CBS 394.84]
MSLNPALHIIPPTAPHTYTIIFLHGRGSDATTFCNEIFESQDSSNRFFTDMFPSVKWVFPCAKKRWAKTEEEEMHQWFDMSSVQRPQEEVVEQKMGLWESVSQVLEVLRAEKELVRGSENVILAGISQGCATAIFSLLTSDARVGGFFGLCGWLPLAEEMEQIMRVPGRSIDVLAMPVLLQHCRDDGVVPVQNGEDLVERLRSMGMQVKWESFENGGHWLNEPRGMDGIVRFIEEVMERGKSSTK